MVSGSAGLYGPGVSRRDFLRVGGLSVVGLSLAEQAVRARERADGRSCIFILMTGGASQIDTFDPKPQAAAAVRGPLRAIPTVVPGTLLSEGLPKLALRANRFSLLRSLSHDAAPIHETGQQLVQTGRLARNGIRYPHFGAVVESQLGGRGDVPANIVLPRFVDNTGVKAYRGQRGGVLGSGFDPVVADVTGLDGRGESHRDGYVPPVTPDDEPDALHRMYGDTRFGRLLLQARQLVERGARTVTVNLFDSLFGRVTWDAHAGGEWSPAGVYDYRDRLCPEFDRAMAGLLDDLQARGLFDRTLVVATGEFGRSPRLNQNGGRDHWPNVWSALVAGAGTQAGAVIGQSDAEGAQPADRPIHPGELIATIQHVVGADLSATMRAEDGRTLPVAEHPPIYELLV